MQECGIRFPRLLSAGMENEVSRRIYYLAEGIAEFSLIWDGDAIAGVDLQFDPSATGTPSEDELLAMLWHDLETSLAVPTKQLWDLSYGDEVSPGIQAVTEELTQSGLMSVAGPGVVAFSEPVLSLVDFIGAMFREISANALSAREWRFPTLIPVSSLHRGGYFESFPHLQMFVGRLRNTPDDFHAFEAMKTNDGLLSDLPRHMTSTGYCLPPTMCYYVYDMLADSVRPEPSVYTTEGKSFRFEHKYESAWRRLWDFTIRETVWVGNSEFTRAGIDDHLRLTRAVCEALGVAGECRTASDPFFMPSDGGKRAAAQRISGSKKELRLAVHQNETIACASFNLHGGHLAERFGIRMPEQPASTSCVGVGIERFAAAILAQFGAVPEKWPDILVDAIWNRRQGQGILDRLGVAA